MARVWNRISVTLQLITLLAVLVLIAMMATRVRGGSLDPPDPPGPTDSVRLPGTPITSLPYNISQPGTYYLTRNLVSSPSGDGITISADNVTLDLQGFALIGPAIPGVGIGIYSDPFTTRRNNAIRNGTIRGWQYAVHTPNFVRSTYEDLRVTDNASGLEIGSGNTVLRVMSAYNLGSGLAIRQQGDAWGGLVADSNFSRNGGSGITLDANNIWIRDCVIDSNATAGISVVVPASYNQITDNRLVGNGGGGQFEGGIVIKGAGANVNLVARNVFIGNNPAVVDLGVGNRIGTFVGGDPSISATNPWSNVVY